MQFPLLYRATDTMPRVLFIDHSAALGGAELYLRDLLQAFPSSTTLTFEDGPLQAALYDQGSRAEILPAARSVLDVKKHGSWREMVRAALHLPHVVGHLVKRARHYDVLFANSQKALVVASIAGWIAGRPVVWNLHDILTGDHFSSATRIAAVWCANLLVDRVIVNSEATREAFVAAGGHRQNTTLVYNGIDPAPFDAVSTHQREALRSDLGIGSVPCVGVFSRLTPWKGQHILLEALTQLPDVHALIVGDALFDGDQEYAQSLRDRVAEAALQDRVHFLGFRSDVPALMKAVDVVVHTSTAPEPFGRVIVEGLLAQRPVVATRAGGATEIIDSGVNGYLVDPRNAGQLVSALERLFDNPAASRDLATAGQRMVVSQFDKTRMQSRVGSVIDSVSRESAGRESPTATSSDMEV